MASPKPSSAEQIIFKDATERNTGWNIAFSLLLAVTFVIFAKWGLGYIGVDASLPVFFLASCFGLFMAFNIGGNDVANSFGTSVGSGTLTIKQALLIAAVFEVSGAIIAGGQVTETVRSGIVDLETIDISPNDLMFIMMSSLLAAAIWLLFASKMGYPVSTTHSIVGGIVGAALMVGFVTGQDNALDMVQWGEIGKIAVSWVLSPLLGGLVSYGMYRWIKKYILQFNEQAEAALEALGTKRKEFVMQHRHSFEVLSDLQGVSYTEALSRDSKRVSSGDFELDELESDYFKELELMDREAKKIDAHRALEKWVPALASFGALVIASMLIFKGLSNLDLALSMSGKMVILAMVSAVAWMATSILVRLLKKKSLQRSTFLVFAWMQVFTASAFAFSHGSNDIANAIGPFVAILDVLRTGNVYETAAIPTIVMITFGVALVGGLWFTGRNVIRTVGTSLTRMHPSSGFAAELSAAMVVMGASVLGLPVSSTHILIGAVLGIGVANRAANWKLMKSIGVTWVVTLPAVSAMSALVVLGLRAIF
ncbi:inorganic phosphate transporter [Flaviflexus equikiangi]|uniref:Phosphate transporter n=1 Tax=Flaviflexus equikiangi TaxID=2758573 RepID=A0ABS2TCP7_9ACTO|nr:inorganic phosphate transporter [Flaviflexus equikiangi]MBM9432402.1 inorganic phosphate transporter [Flaviflexus equikiangi]